MLTEREVLAELERMGIKEPSLVRNSLREFEEYMEINYGVKVIKEEKGEKGVSPSLR
jgi:hypothetical protein